MGVLLGGVCCVRRRGSALTCPSEMLKNESALSSGANDSLSCRSGVCVSAAVAPCCCRDGTLAGGVAMTTSAVLSFRGVDSLWGMRV